MDKWLNDDNLILGLKVLGGILVLATAFGIFQSQMVEEVQLSPCSIGGYPARCYHVSPRSCELIWKKAETSCKDYVGTLSLPPGRLIGPFMFKCQVAQLDKALHYGRRSGPECDDMFVDIKEWAQRNDLGH